MAVAEHNVTRRLLLGATIAAPALLRTRPVTAARPDADAWNGALAAFERAEAELNAFTASCRAARARDLPWEAQAKLDDRFDAHLAAFYEAMRRLLRTPAPGLAALATKVALAVDHDVSTLDGGDQCLAALKGDALRLAGGARD